MQLNEGLEKLGAKETFNGSEYEGEVFEYSAIENVRIPSTVKRLEKETFYDCENLKNIEIPDNVEYIGKNVSRAVR